MSAATVLESGARVFPANPGDIPAGQVTQLLDPAQRPDIGIHHVSEHPYDMRLTTEQVPWLNADVRVALRKIYLTGGGAVLYGSIVSGNNTLSKLADHVCPDRSKQAEAALFTSLPNWLKGQDMPDIDRVPDPYSRFTMYKAGRGRRDPARLFFVRPPDVADVPVILKAAVARHKDQTRVVKMLTTMSDRRGSGWLNG